MTCSFNAHGDPANFVSPFAIMVPAWKRVDSYDNSFCSRALRPVARQSHHGTPSVVLHPISRLISSASLADMTKNPTKIISQVIHFYSGSFSTMGTCDDDRSQAPSVADDEATAPADENDDTIDPRDEEQDIWAQAEGYTPLSDIHYASLMVSMGPSDGEDEDEDDNEDDSGEIRTARGAFFVNPSAFAGAEGEAKDHERGSSNENTDGVAHLPQTTSSPTGGLDDFQNIAEKALSILDKEYERTLKGERRPPSWQEHAFSNEGSALDCKKPAQGGNSSKDPLLEQEDLKIIAAAFDERKITAQKNGFIPQWDNLPPVTQKAVSSSTPLSAGASSSVDTEAVRKVVLSLSEKSDNPFQQKFAAWQQRQQSLPAAHDLIPMTPYKAFRRSTDKAKQATASLSRSATLAEALLRIKEEGLLPKDVPTLVVDIVGVDHVECKSSNRIQSTFRPFIRWIGAWKGCRYQRVQLRLIGRDLTEGSITQGSIDLLTPHTSTLLQSAFATCHSGVYHELFAGTSQPQAAGSTATFTSTAHFAIAFNAGVWGYKEWEATFGYLSERSESSIPFIITAYTLEECEEDWEVVKATVEMKGSAKVLWEAQPNPFASKIIRETKSSTREYRENAAWQAWLLGGQDSK